MAEPMSCPGPDQNAPKLHRRELLRAGLTGFTGFTLTDLMRHRAHSAAPKSKQKTAIILVWLRGGQSHLDTLDPKPDAPAEYRSPFSTIDTNVPGIQITELLPRLAKIADKYSLLRSVAHNAGGHPGGSLRVLSGDPAAADKSKPIYPDWMSVAHFLRYNSRHELPNYIAVNPVDRYDSFQIAGPAYLGPVYEPFRVSGNPNSPNFNVPNIGLKDKKQVARLRGRSDLKTKLDGLDRDIDQSGIMEALDGFETQAMNMLLSKDARSAFDLSRESDSVRERYGRNQWGQQLLLARRLVEAGVEIIATEFDGPLCGRVANWDDHAVNQHVFEANKFRSPTYDQAVSALIEDVYQRGLDKRVLVVVTGEFGRTPRISTGKSSGGGVASGNKGTVQPGRDHWPRANTMLFAGGGIRTGQVIGATDPHGEDPANRRVSPGDFLATLYQHLGIDFNHVALRNLSGRPIPVISRGKPIPELVRA